MRSSVARKNKLHVGVGKDHNGHNVEVLVCRLYCTREGAWEHVADFRHWRSDLPDGLTTRADSSKTSGVEH